MTKRVDWRYIELTNWILVREVILLCVLLIVIVAISLVCWCRKLRIGSPFSASVSTFILAYSDYPMWSRFISSATRRSTRFARRMNSSLGVGAAQTRSHSSRSAWTNGMLLGAGALGLTCAYLTTKAFALNKDPVLISLFWAYRIEQPALEDNPR